MPLPSGQHDASATTPEQRAANSFSIALLLAFTGGYLDAFLYVAHGKVFAGAMTGNAVLFAITLLTRNWPDVLHHALPLLAFFCGVWCAEIIQFRVKHHGPAVGLACEVAGLLTASFLPSRFSDHVFVFLICLLAAFQIGSFRKVGRYPYSSTYITGDLRTTIIALYEGLIARSRLDGVREAAQLGVIFLCFLIGAIAGALLGRSLGNHALWFPVCLLCGALAMLLSTKAAPPQPAPQPQD